MIVKSSSLGTSEALGMGYLGGRKPWAVTALNGQGDGRALMDSLPSVGTSAQPATLPSAKWAIAR